MPKRGGGKRRKRRTHAEPGAESEADGVPRSLVLARGRIPQGVRDLISDVRVVFMPHTAQKLREKKSNTLKDYVSIASKLHVTHIWMFSATEKSPYLRISRLPQGPTLTFKIHEYTTSNHVRATQKRPILLGSADMASSPLLVMNNFSNSGNKEVDLMGETLRHCFPSIDINTLKLSSIRRILLLERDGETGHVWLRSYALKVQPNGLSKPIRKMVVKGRIPKMNGMSDISELLENDLNQGAFSSDSEAENDNNESEVVLPQDMKKLKRGANSKVRLAEIGPRLRLELIKIEGGLCEGPILYHKYVKKKRGAKGKN